jgi:hypothetical protein
LTAIEEWQKEHFSRAYLAAVAASCGWTLGLWTGDQYKVDNTLSKMFWDEDGTNWVQTIDFQLKCTASPDTDSKNFVSFSLTSKDYEVFSKRVGGAPMLLVVMVVPKQLDQWFTLDRHSDGAMHMDATMRHCAYLAFISDEEGNYLGEQKTIRFTKGLHEFSCQSLLSIEQKLLQPGYRIKGLKAELARLEGLGGMQ